MQRCRTQQHPSWVGAVASQEFVIWDFVYCGARYMGIANLGGELPIISSASGFHARIFFPPPRALILRQWLLNMKEEVLSWLQKNPQVSSRMMTSKSNWLICKVGSWMKQCQFHPALVLVTFVVVLMLGQFVTFSSNLQMKSSRNQCKERQFELLQKEM